MYMNCNKIRIGHSLNKGLYVHFIIHIYQIIHKNRREPQVHLPFLPLFLLWPIRYHYNPSSSSPGAIFIFSPPSMSCCPHPTPLAPRLAAFPSFPSHSAPPPRFKHSPITFFLSLPSFPGPSPLFQASASFPSPFRTNPRSQQPRF